MGGLERDGLGGVVGGLEHADNKDNGMSPEVAAVESGTQWPKRYVVTAVTTVRVEAWSMEDAAEIASSADPMSVDVTVERID